MKKDVIVIGSGLSGSLICNELVKGRDVMLLEAGDKYRIEYPRVDFTGKHFGAVKTFCIGGGGTTNIWDNGLIPINPEDVMSESFGWVLNQLGPYSDRAAARLYFSGNKYSNEYDSVLSEMTGVAKNIGVFSNGVDCLLYPKRHKGLGVNSHVDAVYNVLDIAFEVDDDRVEAVHYRTASGRYSVEPDTVIICAGALGTPLLVQKVLSAAGYPYEPVGRGLADHPMGFVGKIKVKKEFQKPVRQMVYSDKGDYICRTAVRVKSECGRYTCCAFFRPALTMQNSLSIYKYKSLLGASSGMQRIKNALSVKLFHPDILAEIYSHLFGKQVKSRIFNLLLLFEQKRGDSRVYYDNSDIQVDWCVTEEEMVAYNSMLKKLNDMLLPISDELIVQMPLTEEWLWSAAHHSGTISLGSMPEDLVDEDLKLRACDNVFVCDGSVIQEHSYANTGLTIGQLGMRLADGLLKRDIV